jgi:hypothetical protein
VQSAVQAPAVPPSPKKPTSAEQTRLREQEERVQFTIGVDTETFHARLPKTASMQTITETARALCQTRQCLTLVDSKPPERYFRFSTERPAQRIDPKVPVVEVICRVKSPYSEEAAMRRLVIRIDTDEDEILMLAQERFGCKLDPLFDTFVSPADNVEYLFETDE